jgi:hypothetical protein
VKSAPGIVLDSIALNLKYASPWYDHGRKVIFLTVEAKNLHHSTPAVFSADQWMLTLASDTFHVVNPADHQPIEAYGIKNEVSLLPGKSATVNFLYLSNGSYSRHQFKKSLNHDTLKAAPIADNDYYLLKGSIR